MITINEVAGAITADAGRRSALAAFWRNASEWLRTCADYYEAAAAYEELARLSNSELARRGLSRDTLARDVCSVRERRV